MKNLERVRSMSPAQLKDWYCAGRDCLKCAFGESRICGFSSWLYAEAREEQPREQFWADEPLEALRMQPRVQRALFASGIHTLGRLYSIRLYDLKRMDGIGDVIAGAISKAFFRYTGEKMKK